MKLERWLSNRFDEIDGVYSRNLFLVKIEDMDSTDKKHLEIQNRLVSYYGFAFKYQGIWSNVEIGKYGIADFMVLINSAIPVFYLNRKSLNFSMRIQFRMSTDAVDDFQCWWGIP